MDFTGTQENVPQALAVAAELEKGAFSYMRQIVLTGFAHVLECVLPRIKTFRRGSGERRK